MVMGVFGINKEAYEELGKLKEMIRTGEGFEPDSPIAELYENYKNKGVANFSVTLSPEFDGTAEDIARSLLEIDKQMNDPVKGLISRIKGHLFLKQDYIGCTEKRTAFMEDGGMKRVAPSEEEKRKIRAYREDIELFEKAIALIEELDKKVRERAD